MKNSNKELSHIAGTFLIDASASFLNGAGLGTGDYDNYSIVKTFQDGQSSRGPYKVPFVSAASWRRWLRDTLIEETGWEESKIRALHKNAKGNTDKISTERNPIDFAEDDIFGYMFTISKADAALAEEDEEENEEETAKGTSVRGLFRTSPFSSSILVGLRKDGWEGKDQNYVHLTEGSAQPYKTQFMNCSLQGVFCLNYNRLGAFTNVGDRMELDQSMVHKYLSNKTIVEKENGGGYFSLEKTAEAESKKGKDKQKKEHFKVIKKVGKLYELTNTETKIERASALLKSLSVMRGGSKQAAFGTDVSPKVMIMAGLTNGNPIFNTLFQDDSVEETRGKNVVLNIEALKEIVADYSDRIVTDVYIGIRTGFMKNDNKIKELNNTEVNGIKFVVTTPIQAAKQMSSYLGSSESQETIGEEMIESTAGAETVEQE